MANTTPYSLTLYDAFSATAFGGSQAAVIDNAASLDIRQRQRIAREIGMPATAFVDDCGEDWVRVQFLSTVMELPMCGHGTLCVLTHLLETGRLKAGRDVELRLPDSSARVSLSLTDGGRYRVMLDVAVPEFVAAPPELDELLGLLGIEAEALDGSVPPETARGDFIHLVIPVASLAAMRKISPDFSGLVRYCHRHTIETIAAFCRESEDPACQLHVRDFCPAVGVPESAAAGTTNAALSSYLVRHGLVDTTPPVIEVLAEQGLELERPSLVRSIVSITADGDIERLQVGGIASRIFQGEIFL